MKQVKEYDIMFVATETFGEEDNRRMHAAVARGDRITISRLGNWKPGCTLFWVRMHKG